MFIIQKIDDGYYFHDKGKIILFETFQEAEKCLQDFQQYCLQRLIEQKGPGGIFELHRVFSSLRIIETNFEETPLCGIVFFHELHR